MDGIKSLITCVNIKGFDEMIRNLLKKDFINLNFLSYEKTAEKKLFKGCSGMALAHSRGTSCAAARCPPQITVVVICSAVNAAMSQARTA